jgi:hypothetical protein
MNIGAKIMRIKNPAIRKPLWVIWFPFEYIQLVHDDIGTWNFKELIKTVFKLGMRGIK